MLRKKWLLTLILTGVPVLVVFDLVTASRSRVASPLATDSITAATPLTHSAVAVVRSDHETLSDPVAPTEPLSYERVREMVWTAIEKAPAKTGLLPSIIQPGDWVVVKPNMVYIKPQYEYSIGDITDPRLTRAVLEYLAEETAAGRITLAMGGSWRGLSGPDDRRDTGPIMQDGVQVDGWTCTWGEDYPGFTGSLADVLDALSQAHPDKVFDRGDFNYDVFPSLENPQKVPVPESNGIGGWSTESYYVSNMILNCDVLVDVPAMKVHDIPGVSLAHKNYMGTASRMMYGVGGWWLGDLHSQPGGPDAVFSDLLSYHPADYVVMGGAWGMEGKGPHHFQGGKPVRTNMVLAGPDMVAVDAVACRIMGFNPWDIENLRRSLAKGYGTLDINYIQVNGDPIEKVALEYEKPPRQNTGLSFYYGRGNRTWLINGVHAGATMDTDQLGGEAQIRPLCGEIDGGQVWTEHISSEDKIDLKNYFYAQTGEYQVDVVAYAFTYVHSVSAQDGYLWLGSDDGIRVWLNGELVWDDPNTGSFSLVEDKVPVHLEAGDNAVLVKIKNESGSYAFSLAAMEEDGDTLPGVEYLLSGAPTAVAEPEGTAVPVEVGLEQNYPNPFNGGTAIRYSLARASEVELAVYNLAGQRVATLVQALRPAGEHSVWWDGRGDQGRLASGAYLYRLRADDQVATRKLMLVQ